MSRARTCLWTRDLELSLPIPLVRLFRISSRGGGFVLGAIDRFDIFLEGDAADDAQFRIEPPAVACRIDIRPWKGLPKLLVAGEIPSEALTFQQSKLGLAFGQLDRSRAPSGYSVGGGPISGIEAAARAVGFQRKQQGVIDGF